METSSPKIKCFFPGDSKNANLRKAIMKDRPFDYLLFPFLKFSLGKKGSGIYRIDYGACIGDWGKSELLAYRDLYITQDFILTGREGYILFHKDLPEERQIDNSACQLHLEHYYLELLEKQIEGANKLKIKEFDICLKKLAQLISDRRDKLGVIAGYLPGEPKLIYRGFIQYYKKTKFLISGHPKADLLKPIFQ